MRSGQLHKVAAIFCLLQTLSQVVQLVHVYPAFSPGNLFDARHAEALAVLYGGHEVRGFEQTVAIARVKPGETTSEEFYLQRAFFQTAIS